MKKVCYHVGMENIHKRKRGRNPLPCKAEGERLIRETTLPYAHIAARIGVTPSTVSRWASQMAEEGGKSEAPESSGAGNGAH